MLLPGWPFIPKAAADDIELAILVDIEDGSGHEFGIFVDDVPAKREIVGADPGWRKNHKKQREACWREHGGILK